MDSTVDPGAHNPFGDGAAVCVVVCLPVRRPDLQLALECSSVQSELLRGLSDVAFVVVRNALDVLPLGTAMFSVLRAAA
ncbi:MAG: hypothetical protein ACI855_005279 [Myxococcota bacterium]